MTRETILLVYRIAGPLFAILAILATLAELKLVELSERSLPGPIYTLFVMLTFLMVFAIPVFIIFALWAAVKHWGDWPIMLPALMIGLCAAAILWGAFAPERLKGIADYLFYGSFLAFGFAATWSGWMSAAADQ